MNISNHDYDGIKRHIEFVKKEIATKYIYKYPGSVFSSDGDIAKDEQINHCYQLLDTAITETEMYRIRTLYLDYDRRIKNRHKIKKNWHYNPDIEIKKLVTV